MSIVLKVLLVISILTFLVTDVHAAHKDWRNMIKNGDQALKNNQFNQAVKHYQKAIEEAKKVKVEDSLLARTYEQLARAYKDQRNMSSAEEYYRKALDVRKAELSTYSEAVVRNMKDLGFCLWSQRKYKAVEEILTEFLAYQSQYNKKEIERPLELLARLKRDQHKYKEANDYLARLLQLDEKELGKNHVEVIEIYKQMARNSREQGKYTDAIKQFQKCISMLRKKHGDANLELAGCIDDLANIYMRKLDYKKAETLLEESLQIRQKLLQEDNTEVLRAMQRLSDCYERLNKVDKAKSLVEAELSILEKSLGEDHIDVANALRRLARLHIKNNNYTLALKTAFKALELRRAITSEKDSSLSKDVRWVADLYAREGRYQESLDLLNRQEKIVKKLLGKTSTEYVRLLKDHRDILNRMNREEDAKKLDDEIKSLEVTS